MILKFLAGLAIGIYVFYIVLFTRYGIEHIRERNWEMVLHYASMIAVVTIIIALLEFIGWG